MLLKLNEKKRWTNPPPTVVEKLKSQDDEIFETARLVKCVAVVFLCKTSNSWFHFTKLWALHIDDQFSFIFFLHLHRLSYTDRETIVNDYVAGFLGLSEGNAWSMNAFDVGPPSLP